MADLLTIAWIFVRSLSLGGVAVAVAGVAVFGWHFVLINARASRVGMNSVPGKSWRGNGARLGLGMLGVGIAMQLASFLLAAILPNGH